MPARAFSGYCDFRSLAGIERLLNLAGRRRRARQLAFKDHTVIDGEIFILEHRRCFTGTRDAGQKTPATLLGMRLRTGRFEKLRSWEPGHPKFVKVGDGQYPLDLTIAVASSVSAGGHANGLHYAVRHGAIDEIDENGVA
jgi:hypothetical protein